MTAVTHKRISRFFRLVIVAGLALPAFSVSAGVNVWTTNGPAGGTIRALAIDPANPSTIYAGTSGEGVFKSGNAGESWTAINNGLTIRYVNVLATDPSAPATIYAGTSGSVFKSRNGGESWTEINNGLTRTSVYVHALVIDPSTPATLYLGIDSGGVFKSTNGGDSWTAMNAGLTNTFVYSLAVDPSAPATLYAGTFSGIFKSTDAGGSWKFTYGYNNASIVALAVDPSTPSNIYAGSAPYEWPPGGVLRSSNGGADWTDAGLSGRQVYALAISSQSTLYAGTDEGLIRGSGSTWTTIGPISPGVVANPGISALAIDPSSPATLYAGTSGAGVFKSRNGGASWTAINAGLIASSVQALAIDPSTPSTLFAGTRGGGVFQSRNGGGSWTPINVGLTNAFVTALAINPSTPATLYAGTMFPGGVFKSINGGESWTPVNAGLGNPLAPDLVDTVGALAIDPSTPSTLYAGVLGHVFKSTDGGRSWIAVDRGLPFYFVTSLAIDPSAPTTLYVGMSGAGIFKSVNGGESWTESLPRHNVNELAIDPSAPTTLYAATEQGVFKSTDGGATWTQRLFTPAVYALAHDPSAPATLYAGRWDYDGTSGAVFRSNDGGESWTPWNAGLTSNFVRALAIDPSTSSRIYAGTDAGVFDYRDASCVPDSTTLCLGGGRFRVTTRWTTPGGQTGSGQAIALAGEDTGFFTFFNEDSVEVAVKVVNGCSANGNFWVFAAGLTDVSVIMTVTDSQTGLVKSYSNAQGTPFQPIQDTGAFATCSADTPARTSSGSSGARAFPSKVMTSFDARATEPCVASATTVCLNDDRFRVRVLWSTRDGATGVGQVLPLTGNTGAFWFFSPSNAEVLVKILNGCDLNSRYWTFAAGLTDVNVLLTVTDTQTGTTQTYTNPQGTPFQPIQDTNAFATCDTATVLPTATPTRRPPPPPTHTAIPTATPSPGPSPTPGDPCLGCWDYKTWTPPSSPCARRPERSGCGPERS